MVSHLMKSKKSNHLMPTSSKPNLKSGLEKDLYKFLKSRKLNFSYEGAKIYFMQPAQKRFYRPDFVFNYTNDLGEAIFIEAKGRFVTADRKKHRIIKEQFPNIKVRFIFSNSKIKIGKKSKTTYGDWCRHYGFDYHCIASTKWVKEIKSLNAN